MSFILIVLILSAQTGEGSYQRLASFDTEAECQARIPPEVVKPKDGRLLILKCVTGARPEPKKPPGDFGEKVT